MSCSKSTGKVPGKYESACPPPSASSFCPLPSKRSRRACASAGKTNRTSLRVDCWPQAAKCRMFQNANMLLLIKNLASHCTSLQALRSEEHTSELQSRENLVCRLLL